MKVPKGGEGYGGGQVPQEFLQDRASDYFWNRYPGIGHKLETYSFDNRIKARIALVTPTPECSDSSLG